eukprot:TRINITY_DN2857_c0_g1_i1.p1 TRINITY_DN2857_c0_g1~~TRINITY_DN2857_c0_g1_i1.p1  ORF type:complete len:162 (+),score=59.86 TRINITY_DN2857_c0_g1_i1:80-565(+)
MAVHTSMGARTPSRLLLAALLLLCVAASARAQCHEYISLSDCDTAPYNVTCSAGSGAINYNYPQGKCTLRFPPPPGSNNRPFLLYVGAPDFLLSPDYTLTVLEETEKGTQQQRLFASGASAHMSPLNFTTSFHGPVTMVLAAPAQIMRYVSTIRYNYQVLD